MSTVENGNKLALKAIEEGINGLLFTVDKKISAANLLRGIDLNKIAVSFIIRTDAVEFASDFFGFVNEQKSTTKNLKGYFDTELISNYITKGIIDASQFDQTAKLVKLASDYANYNAITISGSEYLDSGGNQVQEVAYTLNSLVYLIEELVKRGISKEEVFNTINFKYQFKWFV